MIVVEGNSTRHPCSTRIKLDGETYVTSKVPSKNTDYLCARWIDQRYKYQDLPFMCYKGMDPQKFKVRTDDVWVADHVYWDDYFQQFNPKHRDPSSGTSAVFCVIERWQPEEIGLIGFDWVLDKNSDWFHDAAAELKAIEQLITIIDLRNNNDNPNLRWLRPT